MRASASSRRPASVWECLAKPAAESYEPPTSSPENCYRTARRATALRRARTISQRCYTASTRISTLASILKASTLDTRIGLEGWGTRRGVSQDRREGCGAQNPPNPGLDLRAIANALRKLSFLDISVFDTLVWQQIRP